MPTFFEVVRDVLDRAYSDIDDKKKDEKITARLAELMKQYGNVLVNGGPSYSDEITRFAYVFKYSTAHAEYLNAATAWSPDLRKALEKKQVYITCIGGGPGSDVLGFVKYILSNDLKPKLTYWPAPGSEDTKLGVLMEREVRHGATEVYAGVQA